TTKYTKNTKKENPEFVLSFSSVCFVFFSCFSCISWWLLLLFRRPPMLTRREWLRLSAAGVLGASMSGWLEALAADAEVQGKRKRACILLWMTGGPSQMDTFDLKPGHANGGPFTAMDTSAPGVRISDHLP